jgi:SAM-dependent methyltransferase
MFDTRQAHWDQVYGDKAATDVSWYEAHPGKSIELILATGVRSADPIIDVGSGASLLVDHLLDTGHRDITVLDISAEVLQGLRKRLGGRAESVTMLHHDVTAFEPNRQYALWHDRAAFHFLVAREDRERYADVLHRAVMPNGQVIIATFGPAGPERCSGLPVARYDATTLAAQLGSEFQLVDSSYAAHRTPSGVEQQFLYCRFKRGAP